MFPDGTSHNWYNWGQEVQEALQYLDEVCLKKDGMGLCLIWMFPKIGVPQNVWFILEKVEGDVPQRCRSEVSKGVDPVETTFHLDSLKNAHRILMFCRSFYCPFLAPQERYNKLASQCNRLERAPWSASLQTKGDLQASRLRKVVCLWRWNISLNGKKEHIHGHLMLRLYHVGFIWISLGSSGASTASSIDFFDWLPYICKICKTFYVSRDNWV